MSWIFGNKKQKYIANLEKNNKIREENKNTFVIGNISPQTKEKLAIENDLIKEGKKTKTRQDFLQKDLLSKQDQLFVINNAKIKMGTHLGTFKVLNDTPTIQGKTVGTKVEKSPANFSFLDGFQVLSVVGDWQDVGSAKYQDNEALIKKSTLTVTGKMPPPNAPIEQGKIEFIDSGQINVVENINTAEMPVPDFEKPDFDIEIKLVKDSFVPLGITDFKGKKENDYIQFKYKLIGSAVDSIEWEISDEKVIYKETVLPEIVVNYKKSKGKEIKEKEHIEVGEYPLFWDGFDNDDIYDSAKLNNKRLKVKITAIKGAQKRTDEMEIKPKYSKVDWIDVIIDKRNKKIDATLRVNLRDGGARGLECQTYDIDPDPKIRVEQTECPWDKIPKETLDKYKKEPIKSRTRSFKDLEELALEGIEYHWGRNQNHAVAKNIEINGEKYEVFVKAVNTEENAMDDMKLIYNTNRGWMRSGNPGTVTGVISAIGNLVSREAACYNVGYIKYSNGWGYQSDIDEENEFKDTAAHEIGHEILKAFGDVYYSYGHKGSVNTFTQNMKDDAPEYPISGEIDLMPYFKDNILGGQYAQPNYYQRRVASEKDVLGLLWLSKIILSFIVLITLISCNSSYYSGYVYDGIEKTPISGIKITHLKRSDLKTYSNVDGYFKIPKIKNTVSSLIFYKEPHYTDTIKSFSIQNGEKLMPRFEGETIFLLKKKDRDSVLKAN